MKELPASDTFHRSNFARKVLTQYVELGSLPKKFKINPRLHRQHAARTSQSHHSRFSTRDLCKTGVLQPIGIAQGSNLLEYDRKSGEARRFKTRNDDTRMLDRQRWNRM